MPEDQPLLDPNNLVSNVISPEEFWRRDSAPTSYALTRLDRNPDEAGEAAKLGQATDTSPFIIAMDPEHFQTQHKAALTQQLFQGNQHLRDYVAVHPFGADVSNDDWGQLDKISQFMTRFAGPFGLLTPSVVGKAAQAFSEAHGPGVGIPQEEFQKLDRLSTNPLIQGLVGHLFGDLEPGVAAAWEMQRSFTGGLAALSAAAEQWYTNRTGDPVGAAKFARDLAIFPQVAIPELAGGGAAAPEFAAAARKAGEAMQVAKPWIEAGQPPPARLNPDILQVAKTQARDDAKALDELFTESQKSSTLARDPESFRTFADLKFGDATLGISADKVRELYGDEVPEPEDGKLGWVPHIESQFQRSAESGYDIEVPWKDFLSKASPEVYDAVKDGIRVRHDGLTLDEAKEAKPAEVEPEEPETEGEAAAPVQAHEALSAAVGHGWEVTEGGTDQKFVELPEEGEPGQDVVSQAGTEKSLSSFKVKDLLTKMNFDDLPPDAKLLSDFWGNRMKELASDFPVHVVDRDAFRRLFPRYPNAGGVYYNRQIFLPHDLFQRPAYVASQVMLHEMGHAISVEALHNYPGLRVATSKLMDEVQNYHRTDGGMSGATIPRGTLDPYSYAFKNEKEFISEGVSNPGFRRVLMDTPLSKEMARSLRIGEKTGTIWDAVKQIFKDLWTQLIGKVPENSVMDAFFKLHESIEEANKELQKMVDEGEASFAEELPPEGEVAEKPEEKWGSYRPQGGQEIRYIQFTGIWTEKESNIISRLEQYIKSIAPKFDPQRLIEARKLQLGGKSVHGIYQGFSNAEPLIFYALHDPEGNFRLPEDILGTVRHEAIHYLKDNGFFAPEEWKTLEDASDREGWIQKHGVDETYEGSHEYLTEEAIAHEFQKWNLHPESTHVAADIFRRMRQVFLRLRDLTIKLLGFDPKVEDLFHRIEAGEIGAREPGKIAGAEAPRAQKVEDPELQRVFKNGRALGMNVARLEQYLKLAKDQLDRDHKLARDQAEMEAGAKATKEWKDNYDRVRENVKSDLLARPDIAADRFLRTGELPDGTKLAKIKLDPAAIDPSIRSRIPEEFLRAGGVAPDDLAPVFAFQSGDQLVRSIARLGDERELQGLTPAGHLKGLIDREAENQMQERYGRSAQDIIDEAKEHVVSPTRMDILHAELQALAGDKPISAEAIKAQAKKIFDRVPIGTHSSDKYIAAMGREGEKFETAMIEGNGAEAFQAKQKQVMLAHQLKLSLKLEKDLKSFDTRSERWARRAPPGLRPEDVVWIHQIMRQIGFEKEIGLQDLDRRKALYSEHATLREYVDRENNAPRQAYNSDPDAPAIVDKMPVADFLFTDNYRNTVPEMTPPEFRAVFDSLKTIDHFSREENKTLVRGKKRELAEVVSGLTERLKAAVGGEPITKGEQRKSVGRTVGSLLLNPETWFNRLDLGNRQGPFNQLIVRPLMEGQYTLRGLEKRFAARWKDLGKFEDYNKKIENPGLWLDPREGYAIDMHKGMAYAVLQNMGNELQRRKLLMGWGIAKNEAEIPLAEQKVWSWLQSVGINEKDLARAQKMGEIFGDAFHESEQAYTQLSGVAPARIDLNTMQTPWGESKEWYHPLIPDPLRYRHTPDMNTLLEDGYHRPSPAAGYTKQRTGALYPLDLSLYSPAFRLKQVLNDAAMRVPITQVAKVVYHPAFQEAFAKYYGKEYQSALDAWIKDLAGNRQWVPSNVASMNKVITELQNNLSTLLIGWNLGTVMKHGPTAAVFSSAEVGTSRFLRHLGNLIGESFGSREAWNFAMENSEELQNRMHSTQESLSAVDRDLFPAIKGRFATFREMAQRAGAAPVGVSDLISAVAMWNAEYERLSGLHPDMSHGDLVYAANTAVRRTHGSSLLGARTGLLRAGPFARMMMPFYNFFSNALQRNYEGAVFAKDRWQGKELPEMRDFPAETMEKSKSAGAKVLLGAVLVYGVMPSIIESLAEGGMGQGDKKESWAHWGARTLLQAYPSQVPVVRDLMNYLVRGYDPNLGLYGTLTKDVKDAISPKTWFKDPGTFLRKTNAISGLLTGLNYDSIGRAGQFWLNVEAGKEHPKSPWEYWKGTMRGTLKERR